MHGLSHSHSHLSRSHLTGCPILHVSVLPWPLPRATCYQLWLGWMLSGLLIFLLLRSPEQVTTCLATGVGVAIGYLAYDMIHYGCHHARSLPSFLERQKRVHMAHHYRNHDVSFGISSPLYDYVFGTLPPAEKSE